MALHNLQDVDLAAEFRQRCRTMKRVPLTSRGDYARIQAQVLGHIVQQYRQSADTQHENKVLTWKLLMLLPRLLLHHAARGGESGARELRRRIALFDAGEWDALLTKCRATADANSPRPRLGPVAQQRAKEKAVISLVEQGELSHAARVLRSAGLAPGDQNPLDELRNSELRPRVLRDPLPQESLQFQPQDPLKLDRDIFANVLQQTRKGLSAGLIGMRNEYLKLCLEDDLSLDLLSTVAEFIAQANVPTRIVQTMSVSSITALKKRNGRVRGIAAGDTLRRLVAKTLARQSEEQLRNAAMPANFGLADRSGTDGLVHMVRTLLGSDSSRTLISIDGVGAFDHVSRARIFTELWHRPEFHDLLPFVSCWYGLQLSVEGRHRGATQHHPGGGRRAR